MTLSPETLHRAQAVLAAGDADFLTLAKLGGLDPARHFRGADLRHVDFGTDSLAGVDLREADLSGADLSRARGLTAAMVKGAAWDDTTVWPPGFHAARQGWADDWGTDQYGAWARFSVTAAGGSRVTQRLRWCPPGKFMMGSPDDEDGRFDWEGPLHEVVFARGFWLFETACRQELWQAVTSSNPSWRRWPTPAALPVEAVSFEDVQGFLARVNANVPGIALALPSEAQWEYACRAGTHTPYSCGTEINREQLNFHLSKGTVPVGSLPANWWGLHEMHGNVWEWCADTWHPSYDGAPADGSAWIDERAALRVVRGGSWFNVARHVRAAYRYMYKPVHRDEYLGFRCARVQ